MKYRGRIVLFFYANKCSSAARAILPGPPNFYQYFQILGSLPISTRRAKFYQLREKLEAATSRNRLEIFTNKLELEKFYI